MTAQLNATLPEGYVANLDERLYVTWDERSVYPDVALIRAPTGHLPRESGSTALRDAPTTVLNEIDAEDEAQEITLLVEEQRESYIEILHLGGGSPEERLVALIEVLSPANKSAGRGREEYLRKQRTILSSPVHLLEIDLLRSGQHTVAVPQEAVRQGDTERATDYLVCLHPAGDRRFFRWWPRTIRERLPRVHLPLDAEGGYVPLNLQAAFDRAYDAGPYRRRVDYRRAPDPLLSPEDAAWADALLREKGLR